METHRYVEILQANAEDRDKVSVSVEVYSFQRVPIAREKQDVGWGESAGRAGDASMRSLAVFKADLHTAFTQSQSSFLYNALFNRRTLEPSIFNTD